MERGTLHLVVGPSGAGKDTLIAAVHQARPEILVPTRAVTRPSGRGEEVETLNPDEFARRARAGGFALHWEAHGLSYGIPAEVEAALAAGTDVVVNVSRSVIAEARARFRPLRIIVVTAKPETLARRLAGRGRESAAEIEARLARASYAMPEGQDVAVISNDGPLAASVATFLDLLSPVRA